MSVAADDTRHFETAVELSPEESNENLDYFREQGLQADYEGEGAPPKTEVEAPKPEPVPAAEVEKPAEGQAPAGGEEIDPVSQGEWHEAKTDGEKLGRLAKKTKRINELTSENTLKEGQIAELRRQLEEKVKTPAPSSAGAAPSTSLESPKPPAPKEAPKVEPPKAAEFDKPRPVRPKFEDFVTADDPIAAHADAGLAYTELLQDWKDEKRDFDGQQKTLVREQADQAQRQSSAQQEREQEIEANLTAARTAHPDFDAVTNGKFTPVLSYVLREAAPDGFEIGYELAKPENAEILARLRTSSQHSETETQRQIEKRIARTTYDVAVALSELKSKAAKPAGKRPEKTPEPDPVPEPPPSTRSQKTAEPRREEATPAPTRSRGAAALTLDDIPIEDYDARKKFRVANGLP